MSFEIENTQNPSLETPIPVSGPFSGSSPGLAGNGSSPETTPDEADTGSRKASERQLAANRANAQLSTGPRSEAGKQRVSQNARRYGICLLGLAEARTLNQEPGDALRLYHELIAPYEPGPALLAMHFQDLARLHLELEAGGGEKAFGFQRSTSNFAGALSALQFVVF